MQPRRLLARRLRLDDAIKELRNGRRTKVIGCGLIGPKQLDRIIMRPTSTRGGRRSGRFAVHVTVKLNISLKRAYEPPSPEDGLRVLVDRLWPRGLRKADASIDRWLKEIAPSTELRRWFGHDPARWEEFQLRYRRELSTHQELLSELRALAREGPLTLVYSAHDEDHNDAVVLRDTLEH
jgi:uncharacterized protein YeaO (DUF488 family)